MYYKKTMIALTIILGVMITSARAGTDHRPYGTTDYTDLHCLASLSKARDVLHADGTYNGNDKSLKLYQDLTAIQDQIWIRYMGGHATVHTVKTDKLKITTYNTADKAIKGIRNFCKAYIQI